MHLPVAASALLAQLAALCVTVPVAIFQGKAFGWTSGFMALSVLHGIVAAVLAHLLKLAPWWLPIQLLFLPAVVAASSLQVPAWIYLAAFVVLSLFYWGNFRTRVPLYLSGHEAWRKLLDQLPPVANFRFVDLGSGLGGVPLYLATQRPDGEYVGVEIAPAPWLISCLRARRVRGRVRFLCMDYARLDLSDFDVVFAFLSPAAMPDLWRKANVEMKEGALFLSLSFPVPGVAPDLILDGGDARHTLYAWRMRPRLCAQVAA